MQSYTDCILGRWAKLFFHLNSSFWYKQERNRDQILKAKGLGYSRWGFLSRLFALRFASEEVRGLQFLSLNPLGLLHPNKLWFGVIAGGTFTRCQIQGCLGGKNCEPNWNPFLSPGQRGPHPPAPLVQHSSILCSISSHIFTQIS